MSCPLFQEVRRRIQNGECGKITHIRCNYNRNTNWRVPVDDARHERLLNWRMYREYSGGLMAELCSHHINIVNWVLGAAPVKVSGMGGIDYWKDGMGTEGTIELKKEEGHVANFYAERKKVEAVLSQEEIGKLDAITSATRKAWARGEAVPITVANNTNDDLETTRAMFLEFVECVRSRTQPTSNVDNGREVAIAVDMANLAMENQRIEHWRPEYAG
ncbi:hypothetical protein DCC62_24830 [candidate division KSB1 bacterium]|nr:MAG: hypothetical protein DCC62_24830 [candidate division KSB1 bacterium]